MQCKKCGNMLLDTDKFCQNCGEPAPEANLQNQNINNQPNNILNIDNSHQGYNQENNNINSQSLSTSQDINHPTQNNYQQVAQMPPVQNNNKKSKKPVVLIVLGVIGGFVIGIIALFIAIGAIITAMSDKMICKSNYGNITIMYNEDGLTGYKTSDMTYDYDEQKEYAKQIGVDAYLKEFNTWFINNTYGSCTIDGKEVEQTPDNNGGSNTTTNNGTQVVGDEKRGYVTIPSNWTRFYDIDGNNSLQYSYANIFIVSLDVIDGESSAKTYASNYMYNMQNSSEVTGVTGATVTIGKNKEYTAYQIYMYYPNDSIFLVTYWFEAEDGKVHYIALEGPEGLNDTKLTDYLYIPESFSLKK